METRKLFYEDCHLTRFTARVTGCTPTDRGFAVTLDATAFYPEGGGQACDLGTLADANVLDVQERDGQILHLCDRALPVGREVVGSIDFERRLDQMQQHSGEHIVSGIINGRWGYHNVGFHVGAELVTIDFDGMIPPEAIAEIEAAANAVVWQNIPLKCWYPSREELPGVFYRSKRALPWPVRVVQVPGCDSCACCGVHVAATGEVGLIKIFSMVKFHQGVRIEMACGKRALDYLSAAFEQNRQVSQAFSARILQTGEAARRMNEALAAEKYKVAGLENQVFAAIAAGYAGKGNVLHFGEDLTPVSVRELADRIAAVCGGIASVFSGSDEAGYSFCMMTRQGDLREFGKKMTAALQGRGGGKPSFQQGSVKAAKAQIQAYFKTVDY